MSTRSTMASASGAYYTMQDGKKVFDVEEIVVATDTLPFDDYITCREWHLVSSVFAGERMEMVVEPFAE